MTRESKPCECPVGGPARLRVHLGEPGVDGAGQHPCEGLLPLRTTGVALEEQSLERTELRPANVGPHGGEAVGRFGGRFGQHGHLAAFDLIDDRQ